MVIEPVLGEGGYVPAPTAFLHGLAEHLRRARHPLRGRRGAVAASAAPDACSPSSTAASSPTSSSWPRASRRASRSRPSARRPSSWRRWPKGAHGGTYGGNPIGCAAALATIDVLTAPGFLDDGQARGEQLRTGLPRSGGRAPGIGPGPRPGPDGRDASSMADGAPDAARVAAVASTASTEGRLILMNAGTFGNVLRWMPPLVVTERRDRPGPRRVRQGPVVHCCIAESHCGPCHDGLVEETARRPLDLGGAAAQDSGCGDQRLPRRTRSGQRAVGQAGDAGARW